MEIPKCPHQVFVVMGASGSGKSTIVNALAKYGIREHVSHTTRKARINEVNGKHYYFTTKENFEKLDLLEFAEHSGNFYGVTESEFLRNLGQCPISVIVTEIKGAQQIKQAFPECTTLVFIRANREEVMSRMKERGDSVDSILKRLAYDDENGVWDNWVHADLIIDNTGDVTLEEATQGLLTAMGGAPKPLSKAS